MCGIAGFVGHGAPEIIVDMLAAIAHRGPDGSGKSYDPQSGVHLGHRRLSIIDHSGGSQPMWTEDGDLGITYNGEIYNHVALRRELEALGLVFQSSHSDTEVILKAYKAWGKDAILRFNGMFAFAIYDKRKQTLFLARDRFGEKPLYFSASAQGFVFASEASAILKHPNVTGNINQRALQKLFGYGYIPAPNCLYEGVSKLPAGHWCELDLASGKHVQQCYWKFSLAPDLSMRAQSSEVLADELRALFVQAVERRKIGDVQVGAFLSGGVDSSAIVAALKQLGERLECFTIGFHEDSFDETPFAQAVIEHLDLPHHVRKLTLEQARDEIPKILALLDEPFGDASILPTSLLSAFTRTRAKVALSGDGGDELFAGYDPFRALAPSAAYSKVIPKPLHRFVRTLVEHIPKSGRNMSLDFKLRRTLQGLSFAEPFWAPVWMAPLDPKEASDMFAEPMDARDVFSEALDVWDSGSDTDRVGRMSTFFTRIYLQDNILTKTDRASMMHGLEARTVFLDNDLADFALRLPSELKYARGQTKVLLKQAMAPLLPHDIIHRKKKGFGIPVAEWLKNTPKTPPMAPVGGVNMDWIQQSWSQHRSNKRDHRLLLWTWLALQYSKTASLSAHIPVQRSNNTRSHSDALL